MLYITLLSLPPSAAAAAAVAASRLPKVASATKKGFLFPPHLLFCTPHWWKKSLGDHFPIRQRGRGRGKRRKKGGASLGSCPFFGHIRRSFRHVRGRERKREGETLDTFQYGRRRKRKGRKRGKKGSCVRVV